MDAPRLAVVAARIALAAAIGVAVGVGIFLWIGSANDPGAGAPATPSGHVNGTTDPPPSGATTPTSGASADETDAEADAPAPGDDTDGSSAAPGANSPGIEAAPEPEESPRPPGVVGPLPTPPPLDVPAGPAAPIATRDDLVKGFPSDVIALADSSTVLSSSLTSDGERIQASLEATDTAPVADVIARYTERLVELGFTWSTAEAPDDSTAVSFTRKGHTVVISARPQAEGSLFTVFGIFDETR
jgi:hypothetical protein